MIPFWNRRKEVDRPIGVELQSDLIHIESYQGDLSQMQNRTYRKRRMADPVHLPELRKIYANLLMSSCAYHYMKNRAF